VPKEINKPGSAGPGLEMETKRQVEGEMHARLGFTTSGRRKRLTN
jgi:hypothetical protein